MFEPIWFDFSQCLLTLCMVRPLKMAILLCSGHLLLDLALFHSQNSPALLMIGLSPQPPAGLALPQAGFPGNPDEPT